MFELLQYEFMRNAIMAGILASIACGVVGALVVIKRMVFISGGISHAAFGGIGLGYLIGIDPILGALIFTIISALGMGVMHRKIGISEDAAIGVLWVLGMALGIIFIELRAGYAPDLFGYLFGNILTVPKSDLVIMLILDLAILSVAILLYKEFLAVSFDEEFAVVAGVPADLIYMTLLSLIALTVVVMIRIVGVILTIAMLTIPTTIAWQFSYNLKEIMLIATLMSSTFIIGGLWLSYIMNLAPGATIVLISIAAFAFSSIIKKSLR